MDIFGYAEQLARHVVPVTVFFVLTAIGLALARKQQWAYWLALCSFAFLVLLGTPAATRVATGLLGESAPLSRAQIAALSRNDALIVVLTAGKRRAAEYPHGETASSHGVERARYGAWLAKATGLPLAVSGGLPRGSGRSEAVVTTDFIELELNQKVALIEGESINTRDSAKRLAQMLPAKKPTIVLVTDFIHMPRSARAFEAAGLPVIRAPMGFQYSTELRPVDYLPSPRGFETATLVYHELIGGWWYRLTEHRQ
jgi:uncharacterized SAM-binding protein YcdF (DUF218 family)